MSEEPQKRPKIILDPEDDCFYSKLSALITRRIQILSEYSLRIESHVGHVEPFILVIKTLSVGKNIIEFDYVIYLDDLDYEDIENSAMSEIASLKLNLDNWLYLQGIILSET